MTQMTVDRITEPARKDLLRSVPFTLTRDDDGTRSDGLTLDGYAAVFGIFTEINSWEGTFEEEVAKGAFKKSIRERTPVLQFDHGTHPMVGSLPIGTIEDLAEDDHGLHVLARLIDNWLTQPVRDGIEAGAIAGMSFRFTVIRDEWRDQAGKKLTDPDDIMHRLWYPDEDGPLKRTLLELKCSELGPVVFPAYDDTSVGVRSKVTIDLGRLDDPEQRRELARAVLIADAASAPEDTHNRAVDHATTIAPSDTPQATDDPSAGEHESPAPTERPRLSDEKTQKLHQSMRYYLRRHEATRER